MPPVSAMQERNKNGQKMENRRLYGLEAEDQDKCE